MVNVFVADISCLKEDEIYNSLYEKLPRFRKDKVDKINSPKGKMQSVGAGAVLAKALDSFGIDASQINIAFKENEKPYIEGEENVHFSLSHSGDKVMAVISNNDVGCDVELVGADRMKLAKRFFCKEEYNAIIQQSPEGRMDYFTRMWTLKESFMKVTGLGMKLGLSEFLITIDSKAAENMNNKTIYNEIKVTWDRDDREYHFVELQMNDNYKYSICQANEEIDCINLYEIKLNDFN